MKTIEAKVVALGSQGVGKTSMIVRYVGKVFKHHVNPTIGASFFTCKLNAGNASVRLQVWDTAGQERFRSMAPMYYRNANAAMLVFDLTQYCTFAAIKGWVRELRRNVEAAMVLAVIGNKSDLTEERQVDGEEGRIYATKIGASYHETSVLHDEGIETVFLAIAAGLVDLSDAGDRDSSDKSPSTLLRTYDSSSASPASPLSPASPAWRITPEMPLTPETEESPQNASIAHGIHEKPHACC